MFDWVNSQGTFVIALIGVIVLSVVARTWRRRMLDRAVHNVENGITADSVGNPHVDKMILSQDANCFSDWFPPGLEAQISPNWHFLHVVNDVVPALLERGVTQDQVDQMMQANPRRFFEL